MIRASIVVHKTPESQLSKALECLLKSDINKVYIIDNSPTDDLKQTVEGLDRVEYLHVTNRGFGAGHNIGIRKSIQDGADFHLVMNADVWWQGDIIRELLDYMSQYPRIGLIAPKIFYPNGELQYSCRMLPTPVDLFVKRFLPETLSRNRMKKYLLSDHNHDFPLNCPYLLGSFLLFKIEALKECGIFDERFFMYPEDIDITRRIHEKWKTLYWPKVSIIHEHQQASKKNFKMFWIHFTNMIKYFNKWGWLKDSKRDIYNQYLRRDIYSIKN